MASMASPMDRIASLENIEKDVASVLQHAGHALTELSKDKPANKNVESHVQQFIKTLSNVESELSKQINYLTQVSTGQAHEGSSYNAQKTLQMTWHRLEHIRSEVNELDKLKNNQRIFRQPQQQPTQTSQSGTQQQQQQQGTGTQQQNLGSHYQQQYQMQQQSQQQMQQQPSNN